jgi:hypothetical protein
VKLCAIFTVLTEEMLKKKKAIVQGFEMLVQLFYLADMEQK